MRELTNTRSNPWAKYDARPYEWLFSEDSFQRSIERNMPVRIFKYCQYQGIEKRPYYSVEDSTEPEGFQDIAIFASSEGDKFELAKRIVDLEGQGRLHIGDFVTLHVRGCCNIVGIIEQ